MDRLVVWLKQHRLQPRVQTVVKDGGSRPSLGRSLGVSIVSLLVLVSVFLGAWYWPPGSLRIAGQEELKTGPTDNGSPAKVSAKAMDEDGLPSPLTTDVASPSPPQPTARTDTPQALADGRLLADYFASMVAIRRIEGLD